METDLVKMSPKGQLVIPQHIREKEGFHTGDRFVPFHVKGGIFFKKIEIPNLEREFEKLSKDIAPKFKKRNITQKDVKKAVQWAKKSSSR